jgi:hypothetical protein
LIILIEQWNPSLCCLTHSVSRSSASREWKAEVRFGLDHPAVANVARALAKLLPVSIVHFDIPAKLVAENLGYRVQPCRIVTTSDQLLQETLNMKQ